MIHVLPQRRPRLLRPRQLFLTPSPSADPDSNEAVSKALDFEVFFLPRARRSPEQLVPSLFPPLSIVVAHTEINITVSVPGEYGA